MTFHTRPTTLSRPGLRAAARSCALVLAGAGACLAGPALVPGASPQLGTPATALTALVVLLVAAATGLRAYVAASSHHRWLAEQLAGQQLPGERPASSAQANTLAGLMARAVAAETSASQAMVRAQQAATGMAMASAAAVTAEETARAHIVAELHDTVAQELVLASYLEWDESADKDAVLLRARAAERQLRDIMAAQRPPQLENISLADAVAALASDAHARWNLRVDLDWHAEPTGIPYSHAITIYRFIQEGLANVAKHAGVPDAAVRVRLAGGRAEVTVTDAGAGFDPSTRPGPRGVGGRHIGLDMLHRRVQMLAGTIEMVSEPGGGTRLVLHLPVPRRDTDAAREPLPSPQLP